MARKNVIQTFKMLDAADISTNQLSVDTSSINLDSGSIVVEWTGTTPVGVITIEATNDDPKDPLGATYRDLDFGSAINVSGNSGSHEIILNQLPFRAFRFRYTASSGTGSLTATLTAKTLGA